MDQSQVAGLLVAINQSQPFVPPYLFAQIAGNPVLRILEMVASGQMILEPKRPPGDEKAKQADAPHASNGSGDPLPQSKEGAS